MRWLILLGMVACSGSSDEKGTDTESDTDTQTDTGTDTDTETETEDCTDTGAESDTSGIPGAHLTGSIWAGGVGVPRADLRLCRGDACRNGTTDCDGKFVFTDVELDWHSFEAKGVDGFAVGFAPLDFSGDTSREVDLVLQPLGPSYDLGAPTELELGEGMLVTVGKADLKEPLFSPEPSTAAGVRVPEADWVPVDIPGTVVAMWALSPFDYKAEAGVPVRFDNAVLGLPEGNEYAVYVGSYESSRWEPAGMVTAGADYVEGSGSLPLFSTVILIEE